MPTPTQRAAALLLAYCTPRQQREWRAERAITVRAASGRAYHISGRKRWYNIRYLGPGGVPPWPSDEGSWTRRGVRPGGCLCISLKDGPLADAVLALKLVLEADDGAVLAAAPRAGSYGPTWLERAEKQRAQRGLPRLTTCRRAC